MRVMTDNLALVKGIVDRMLLSGDLRPLLDGLAEDVALRVGPSDGGEHQAAGKAAVLDYFEPLGDLITFWRVRYSWRGARVVVLAEESFTIQPAGLAARSELALIFDVRDGLITRLAIEENPSRLAASEELPELRPGCGDILTL
jgi:ketosteroid isomerase-like protein